MIPVRVIGECRVPSARPRASARHVATVAALGTSLSLPTVITQQSRRAQLRRRRQRRIHQVDNPDKGIHSRPPDDERIGGQPAQRRAIIAELSLAPAPASVASPAPAPSPAPTRRETRGFICARPHTAGAIST